MAIIDPIFRELIPDKPRTIVTAAVYIDLIATATNDVQSIPGLPGIVVPSLHMWFADRRQLRIYLWEKMDETFHRPMRGRFHHTHKGKMPKRGNPCRPTKTR